MAGGGGDGGNEEEFELNLAPIIDCFTVLITYMLVSASFLSLSMLEVQPIPIPIPSSDVEPPQSELVKKDISLVIEIDLNGTVHLKMTGTPVNLMTVSGFENKINEQALEEKLKYVQTLTKNLKDASIKANRSLKYKQLAIVIEKVKLFYPTVFVGD
jgi:biopolymer transport protein ExbD